MKNRVRRKKNTINKNYSYFIYAGVIITILQFWLLKNFYQEQKMIKLPDKLFQSSIEYPEEELIPEPPDTSFIDDPGTSAANAACEETGNGEIYEAEVQDTAEGSNGPEEQVLSDTQKQIVLTLLEILDEDIEYGYEVFPDSGYPTNNIWISTDVISIVLKEAGFDLMELIYEDMSEHREDYPMDIKGRDEAIKYIDFRDVFFQEQFFKRNAFELPVEYNNEDPNNNILWQPGDIIFFQFDPDNPYKDLGGFVSSRKNQQGVPLVIMISAEFGTVKEVDVLQEYNIVGHYRYPPPEVD